MNRKIINRQLKIAFMRRPIEEGFALPITLGLGLIMILIAATLIVRAQGDQTTALAQKATNQGLSAAETGITRYQTIINNNRIIAMYSRTGTISWTNASSFNTCNNGTTSLPTNITTTDWQNVDSNDSSKGQYKFIDYTYSPTPGVAPGTGTLTVEGRVNQVGSGSAATKGVSTATTRLQVNIPVLQPILSGTPIPGAWIKTGGTGNNTIDGNVFLNDCNVALNDVNIAATNSVTGQPNTKSYTAMSFPSLPSKPTFVPTQVLGAIDGSRMSALRATSIGGRHQRLTLPRTGDITNSSGVYEYSVSSIDIPNNSELVITAGQKVKLYLDGGITSGGNIIHNCGATTGCKTTNFQVFGYGAAGTQICMSGNNYIEAFIFAPEYTVGVAGAGGGAGGIKGSVWVKNWSNGSGCGSNTSNIVVVQNADWADIGLTPQNLPPQIASVSSWQRQETP